MGTPRTRAIESWSRRGAVLLPKSTVHGWLTEGKIPRHWDQLRALLEFLDVENPEEWRPLWSKATAPTQGAEPARPRFWRRSAVVAVAVLGAITVGGVVTWLSVGGTSQSANCHEAVEYRVSEDGNVVDENGRGFAQVLPGDRFLHDPTSTTRTASEGRIHGHVIGRDITGFVRTHKLAFTQRVQVCP